jgi:feruloyl esterase
MIRRLFAGTLVASIPLFAHASLAAAPPVDCATLVALTIPDVTINAATTVAGSQTAMTLPPFCRVEATARPTSDSEIKFEVWIPVSEAWNGKFQGVGNGGYQGSISYAAMATALRRGYATASTDTGHTGDDVIFGQGHPEKVIDFGHRAIHVMTTSAKLVIRNATGRFAERSYFVGCSSGGHQALSEAQRYPDDYDGIVAGAPANDRIRQTFGFLGSWLATHAADGTPLLTQPKLALLTKSAVAACDANDGLKDGLIDDPRRCTFDPETLACKAGADEASCLTPAQVTAAQRMYEGTRNPRTGRQIYTGWPRGSEAFGESAIQGWRQYITDAKEPSRVGVFKYFLFHNPSLDFRTIDFDRDLAYAEQQIPHLAAVDTNLAPFKRRGGKLLVYTGRATTDRGGVLRRRDEDHGRPGGDAGLLPAVHGTGHGALLRRAGSEPIRCRRRARTMGGEGHGARATAGDPQHGRQGRTLAAAVRVSESGALQGHRQHRRSRELYLRSRACAALTSSSVNAAARNGMLSSMAATSFSVTPSACSRAVSMNNWLFAASP